MKENYAYLLIVAASIIWGTMGVLGKLALAYGIQPITLVALRELVGFLTILVPIFLLKKGLFQIQRNDIFKLLMFGIFAIAFQRIAYFYAVNLTTATMAAILFYTYPIIITIYSSMFLKEKITPSTVFAIILTFLGVAFVVKAYEVSKLSTSLIGIIYGLFSSILFALYFLTAKKLRNRYTNWTLILYGDGIAALALTPIIYISFPEIVSFPQELWLLVLAIAWFPSLLAYLIYSYALKHVEASKGSIISVIEPLAAAFFSAAILKENFESLQILGVILALTGVFLLFYKPKLKN